MRVWLEQKVISMQAELVEVGQLRRDMIKKDVEMTRLRRRVDEVNKKQRKSAGLVRLAALGFITPEIWECVSGSYTKTELRVMRHLNAETTTLRHLSGMAEILGIGRSTLVSALASLVSRGLLERENIKNWINYYPVVARRKKWSPKMVS